MFRSHRLVRAMLVVGITVSASHAWAVPAGYAVGSVPGAPGGTSAVAYASDGTLYCSDMSDGSVCVASPDGSTHTLTVSGASLASVGGMCVSPDDSTLYITDSKGFGDGAGELYAVDVATGQAATLVTGMDAIDNVGVRPTGEVFVSDAAGLGIGAVHQVDPAGGGVTATVVSGLDFAAGLGFDSAGNLIYQQAATYSFIGEVYRLAITDAPGGLAFGAPELLATGLAASFSLAVDGEDDVFVSGAGGLFELDRDASGEFLGTAGVLDPQDFSTEVAYWAGGTNPFEPYAGYDGGRLTCIASYGASALTSITTVPEPAALVVLAVGATALLRRRAGRRRESSSGTEAA